MQTETPVVLVTGAAQRIGAAIATKFHHMNYRVIVHYRHSAAAARQLADAFNAQRPQSAALLQADLTIADEVTRLSTQAVPCGGRLDVLVNNASSFYPTPFGAVEQSHWDDLVGSNLRGAFFLSQGCAAALRQQQGAIINLIGTHADKPLMQHSVYSIAKAGVLHLTRVAAMQLAGTGIRVNSISPGAVATPIFSVGTEMSNEQAMQSMAIIEAELAKIVPVKRAGSSEDIAAAAVYLASDESAYVTAQDLAVDGGLIAGYTMEEMFQKFGGLHKALSEKLKS